MPHYKKLVGDQCYLSPVSSEDAARMTQWLNDLQVMIPLGDEAYTPMSLEKTQEFIGEDIKKQRHIFSIVGLATDAHIGWCLLFDVDHINRRAILGIAIGDKDYWGKGYGQEAIRLLLNYGFNLLNLNNIMLGVFAFNERAIHCYQKVGFREIGRRRQARIIGGIKYDAVLMDILAEEFQPVYVNVFIESSKLAGGS